MAAPLTPHEATVMTLLNSGSSVKEIATTLKCSPPTVRTYMRYARIKLDAKTTIQAAVTFDRQERKKRVGP